MSFDVILFALQRREPRENNLYICYTLRTAHVLKVIDPFMVVYWTQQRHQLAEKIMTGADTTVPPRVETLAVPVSKRSIYCTFVPGKAGIIVSFDGNKPVDSSRPPPVDYVEKRAFICDAKLFFKNIAGHKEVRKRGPREGRGTGFIFN